MNIDKYLTKKVVLSDNNNFPYCLSLYLVSAPCILLHIIIYIYQYFVLNLVLAQNSFQYAIMIYISDTY